MTVRSPALDDRAVAMRKILIPQETRCVQSAVRPSLRRRRCRGQRGVRDGEWPAHVLRTTSPPCQSDPVTVAFALRISSLDSIVMRVSPRPTAPDGARTGFRARSAAAPDQRSAGTGAGSRPSAQRSHPAIRLVVGTSRYRPFDRRRQDRILEGGSHSGLGTGVGSVLPVRRRGQVG